MAAENSNEETVIAEGNLYRYWPGIQSNFQERYAQLTDQGFKYFENVYKAGKCVKNQPAPLVSVPFNAIASVVKLPSKTFERQRNRNYLKEQELFNNLLEIKLNCTFDELYKYR